MRLLRATLFGIVALSMGLFMAGPAAAQDATP